ncbi:signal recognition particle 14 kDa protein [Anopheles arabiensis]|uniref:Signal recognition particle 14 kDa protein n=5 Tax=gambiae species complex TaxID=44542 RepID=A0A1S4GXZ6_ANOGA|nr:signal recognition particle 14 kDa protein [Anopheles arabiensis]XP_040235207.1 signal recognition particle 14 kDa protein [Anopheles coluzzii]XP_317118.5 signal recognition particle 14 kDa protein [Anopheles gambiae]
MVLLTNEEFLSKLTLLAQSARKDSSFTVTIKRYDGHDRPKPREGKPPLPTPAEYSCLIRARSGAKKLSTVVKRDEVAKFMESYSKVLKSSMDGLKKVKKVKNKAKAAQG